MESTDRHSVARTVLGARRLAVALTATAIAGALAAGCGGGSDEPSAAGSTGKSSAGQTLMIYSSLPLQGDSRPQSQDILNAEKLALKKAGNRAGDHKIKLVSLDDATAAAGKWDPGQVSANARKAATDTSAVAYIGEFNSGASAVSLPILNGAGLAQVAFNSYVGLTQSKGAEKGEPDKYYPTGKRTYARVVPPDDRQAAALVNWMKQQGVSKLYIFNDKEVYGAGVATLVDDKAKAAGITVLGNDGIDAKAANFRALGSKVRSAGADAMFFGGITQNGAVQLFRDIYAANPNIKLFGPDGVAEDAFASNLGTAAKATYVSAPTLDPSAYPPAAQEFYEDFKATYGKDPETYAIYGYEAMSLVLDAISRAGDNAGNREAVIKAIFETRNRDSVLGRYSIDPNGDTTVDSYGGNRIKDGKIVFSSVLSSAAG